MKLTDLVVTFVQLILTDVICYRDIACTFLIFTLTYEATHSVSPTVNWLQYGMWFSRYFALFIQIIYRVIIVNAVKPM